jgi:oligopeptide transport system ATP-binding protein
MLLEVRDLHVEFHTRDGVAKAVNGVDYTVDSGETLAVLGESGSGKSVTAQAIMGILDVPPGRIAGGEILFQGQDLLKLKEEERRKVRGAKMAMIFQDALSSLNPVLSVGEQLGEMFTVHKGMSRKDAKARAVELMDTVRIPAAKERVGQYPHQFSGGMRQRIMIAMALALEPDLIIADEPTTALDVTVQAQVMDLLAELQREFNMGLILITHDLGVVADVADKIAVMYAGRIVEFGDATTVLDRPLHPYTHGLIGSVPSRNKRGERLRQIPGMTPSLLSLPAGCAFRMRCAHADAACETEPPAELRDGRGLRCFHPMEQAA